MLRAIDALPENYRVPLILKYYGDLSYDEIADHLGTTHSNVGVLLHRAKRELRGRIITLGKEES
jgi:RNA polymerase sigma-70 factor (ECF subfamily)